jgi:hypothetical protein
VSTRTGCGSRGSATGGCSSLTSWTSWTGFTASTRGSCAAGADLAVPDLDAVPVFVNLAGGTRFAPWQPGSVYDLVGRLRRDLAGQVPAAWTPTGCGTRTRPPRK